MLASVWGREGRASRGFRRRCTPPLLMKCVEVMTLVTEGETAGRRVDGPLRACPTPAMYKPAVIPPSVAVNALSVLHLLVQDEQVLMEGAGG